MGDGPLVFVTLGTVFEGRSSRSSGLIADALADQPFEVVIALGPGIPP